MLQGGRMPVANFHSPFVRPRPAARGVTLVELLLIVAVLGILVTTAVPAFTDWIAKARVKNATENIHGLILVARNEGTIRDANLFVSINTSHWCVGVAAFTGCDCTITTGESSCVLSVGESNVLHAVVGDDFPGVSISENFPGVGTRFNRLRKTASPAGTLAISSRGQTLEIKVGLAGRVRVCNPGTVGFSGYPSC